MKLSRQEILEMWQRMGAAWAARDQDAILSFYTDDVYFEHLDGRSAVGKEAVRQLLFGNMGSAYVFKNNELIIDEELQRVVSTWDYAQPTRSGSTFEMFALDIYTLRDGQISEKRVYGKSYTLLDKKYVPWKPGTPAELPADFGYRPVPKVSVG